MPRARVTWRVMPTSKPEKRMIEISITTRYVVDAESADRAAEAAVARLISMISETSEQEVLDEFARDLWLGAQPRPDEPTP